MKEFKLPLRFRVDGLKTESRGCWLDFECKIPIVWDLVGLSHTGYTIKDFQKNYDRPLKRFDPDTSLPPIKCLTPSVYITIGINKK